MASLSVHTNSQTNTAVLDDAHIGDIHGALGSIRIGEEIGNSKWLRRIKTLLAIVGPGLIVMVGDNDAGAFGTYTQAGQNFGTTLLWTLMLLIPVIYVNQEMVLRLGAVTGVGHARLILERFGKFWGAFSVIDLFILNALTIVTEFIGISLAVKYLGLPTIPSVIAAAVIVIAAASTGSFKRFERVSLALVAGSLVLIPILLMAHPPLGQVAHNFFIPSMPHGSELSTVMLLIIAIVGTTVAPWQLFFQQSYIIDKRITPKFIKYERVDLWIGIAMVVVGAGAMMSFCAAAFSGHPGFGQFVDAGQVAAGLGQNVSHAAGIMFAIALLDASIIGTAAVSLSTAYAVGDVLSLKHSLHRKPGDAKAFYAIYVGLIALSAAIVLIPDSPLGLITEGVQTLAGVLLPSATVFLLLLCNDRQVLGPWVNKRSTNVFSALVVGALVLLSAILIAAVIFPNLSSAAMIKMILAGIGVGIVLTGWWLVKLRKTPVRKTVAVSESERDSWRMPPLSKIKKPVLSLETRLGLGALQMYLIGAIVLVVFRIVQLALK